MADESAEKSAPVVVAVDLDEVLVRCLEQSGLHLVADFGTSLPQ